MTSRTNSAQSTLTNKSRLKLLQQREEHLQDLFSTARDAVDALARDEGRYAQFLEGAIVQGYLHLLEPAATVHARNKDVALAERAAGAAAEQYAAISGRAVSFTVVGSLSDDLCVSSRFMCFPGSPLSCAGRGDRLACLGVWCLYADRCDAGPVVSSSSAARSASRWTTRSTNGYGSSRTGYVLPARVSSRRLMSGCARTDAARDPHGSVRLEPQPEVLHMKDGGGVIPLACADTETSARSLYIIHSLLTYSILAMGRVELVRAACVQEYQPRIVQQAQ